MENKLHANELGNRWYGKGPSFAYLLVEMKVKGVQDLNDDSLFVKVPPICVL